MRVGVCVGAMVSVGAAVFVAVDVAVRVAGDPVAVQAPSAHAVGAGAHPKQSDRQTMAGKVEERMRFILCIRFRRRPRCPMRANPRR